MPVTTLDANTALVVIDLQKGILGLPTVHPSADILANAVRLANAFRARGLPVVLVTVEGGAPGRTQQSRPAMQRADDWADLAPDLDKQPGDIHVIKQTWGAFASTDIEKQLRDRGVTQVVLCGVSTSIGVESTARQAYEAGFNVTVAIDAVTDTVADNHRNSVERIFPRLGETGTTAEVLALLGAKP